MTHFSFKTLLFCGLYLAFYSNPATAAEEPAKTDMHMPIVDLLRPVTELISANPWVQGSIVIVITFTIASLTTWLAFKIIRNITGRTSYALDDQIAALLHPPVYYTLVVIGLTAGLSLMPISERWDILIKRVIQTMNVLVWVIFLIRLATLLINRVAGLSDKVRFIQHRTVTLFDNIAKVAIFGAGTYAIFVIWHIDMTAWLASAGIVGIAVGFAAKDTLSNLFSGVFILADAPYKVGDYVVLDGVGRGKVTNIGLRSTRILTRDDIEITVPNSIIGNSTIVNQSGGPHEKLRVRLKIGVAYGSDIDLVKKILREIADDNHFACKLPEPRVRFRVFGASSLDFELLFWVNNPEERGRALDAMNSEVYKRFNSNKIEIPYSKHDVYIKSMPESMTSSHDISS